MNMQGNNICRWYQMNSKESFIPHNCIRALYEDSRQHLWVASDRGLLRYNPMNGQFISYLFDDLKNWVYDILETPNGDLWLATFCGVYGFSSEQSPEGGLLKTKYHFTHDQGLYSNDIYQLALDRDNNLWVLSNNHHIDRINLTTNTILPIEKIIGNLLSNAVKYASNSILVEEEEKDNNLVIKVTDDGPGIKSEYIDKIFESFFQIENNAKRAGSGLGLSLSKMLANKHGGSISVISNYGYGCTFIFTIPMNIQMTVLQSDENNVQTETAGTEEIQHIYTNEMDGKYKIVLAEDNQELRSFLKEYLSDYLRVYEAENGLEALGLIENENIDIIISDIMMPEMDGLEFCKTIKTNPAYSHLPFILLSAKTDTATKIEGLNIGADVYMEKPFSSEQLRAQINSIISNRNSFREKLLKSPLDYYKQNNVESDANTEFIEKLNNIILENLVNDNFSIENLSEMFLMSRSNLHKKIKNVTGMTPNDYIKLIRLNQSAQLLATGKYKINEVCYLVGFNTPSYFSKCFYEHFGKLPKDFLEMN